MTNQQSQAIAQAVLDYLSNQTFQGDPILHAIIACDFVSREHMAKALSRIVEHTSEVFEAYMHGRIALRFLPPARSP